MKKKSDNRHGKHHEDKVQFGGMVTPEFKALAILTVSMLKLDTLMDLMSEGVTLEATKAGILKDGKVLPQFESAISNIAAEIRRKLEEKRRTK